MKTCMDSVPHHRIALRRNDAFFTTPFTFSSLQSLTMNASVLFPNSPVLYFAALEQNSSTTAPTDTRRNKIQKKKSKTAHRRRQQRKRQCVTDDSVVMVVVDGRQHRVKVSTLKQGFAKALARKESKNKTGGTKKQRSEKKRTAKIRTHNESNKKKQKKTNAEQKCTMKERGMLPEERAFQQLIRSAEQMDDAVDMERKQVMLKDIGYMMRRLAVQGQSLPEERAYQLLIQPKEFRRHEILKDLEAMKKRINRDILPKEGAYQQLMEMVNLMTHDSPWLT